MLGIIAQRVQPILARTQRSVGGSLAFHTMFAGVQDRGLNQAWPRVFLYIFNIAYCTV